MSASLSLLSVPLQLHGPAAVSEPGCPITVGLCLPSGLVKRASALVLHDHQQRPILLQAAPLASWADGSLKWVLLDFRATDLPAGTTTWTVSWPATPPASRAAYEDSVPLQHEPQALEVRDSHLVLTDASEAACCRTQELAFRLTTPRGRTCLPVFTSVAPEFAGPVRTTFLAQGHFPHCRGLRLVARVSLFPGTHLVKLEVRLHNPRRARHRHGLWDLGDRGSILFRQFAVQIAPSPKGAAPVVAWQCEPTESAPSQGGDRMAVYQDSSGGPQWRSRNHVNRQGALPCQIRGYRASAGARHWNGMRANPTVAVGHEAAALAVAVPEFWQQFPKSLVAEEGQIEVGLFPSQWGDLHELQGGEQKTHTFWLASGTNAAALVESLRWVHEPVRATWPPEWYAAARVFPWYQPAAVDQDSAFPQIMETVVDGPRSFFARREAIDEYGWRNFGDVWANHEEASIGYAGPRPVISHYNNQYDLLAGLILQGARSGDPRWFALWEPLARHVADIDIYHTTEDRPAYNGSLFWHTDHYRDAATSTHRTFSRANRRRGAPYGGGPSCEHNYTTGLLYGYYLTGSPDAREAVLTLADAVLAKDDDPDSFLAAFDAGPTGLASATLQPHYHGPGRGAGNSVNALLDAWLLSGCDTYLARAEELIRRVVHPQQDLAALALLNAELRWSYTVFLSVLARYLNVKAEAGRLDAMYGYGVAVLRHFAAWMLEHERPYFEHPEALEYPTETWGAQELRKANVLRMAARYAEEPQRSRLLARGRELADRGWHDWRRFETSDVTRALAILMSEGTRDAYFRTQEEPPAPAAPLPSLAPWAPFVSRHDRVLARAKSVRGCAGLLGALAKPSTAARLLRSLRYRI